MKIKEGYILKDVAGNKIVIATGSEKMNFNGVMTFNSVGAEIFTMIDEGMAPEEIIKKIAGEYSADEATVRKDFAALTEKMRKYGILEE